MVNKTEIRDLVKSLAEDSEADPKLRERAQRFRREDPELHGETKTQKRVRVMAILGKPDKDLEAPELERVIDYLRNEDALQGEAVYERLRILEISRDASRAVRRVASAVVERDLLDAGEVEKRIERMIRSPSKDVDQESFERLMARIKEQWPTLDESV